MFKLFVFSHLCVFFGCAVTVAGGIPVVDLTASPRVDVPDGAGGTGPPVRSRYRTCIYLCCWRAHSQPGTWLKCWSSSGPRRFAERASWTRGRGPSGTDPAATDSAGPRFRVILDCTSDRYACFDGLWGGWCGAVRRFDGAAGV